MTTAAGLHMEPIMESLVRLGFQEVNDMVID